MSVELQIILLKSLVSDPQGELSRRAKGKQRSPSLTKMISVDPILGALTDSGKLIYPLLIAGRVSIDDVRKIMGETAQIRHTLEPPMKYVLCKTSSLSDLITKTRRAGEGSGSRVCHRIPESRDASLYRPRHSLIREEIRKKLKKNQMKYAAPIEVRHKG